MNLLLIRRLTLFSILAFSLTPSVVVADIKIDITSKEYGAIANDNISDSDAIQKAINDVHKAGGGTVYIPTGIFLLDHRHMTSPQGKIAGVSPLYIRSSVTLSGDGPSSILKVVDHAYGVGAFFRALSSEAGAKNLKISNITVDGNKDNQVPSTQASNILIEGKENIVISDVNLINANGNGVMIRGTRSNPVENVQVYDNTVLNGTMIGIQVSQFNGVIIRGNSVKGYRDNCIDLYGDDGDRTVNGLNFTVTGNSLRHCSVGVFPETVAQGVVANNVISNTTRAGVHVNRINGEPKEVLIVNNNISETPLGVYITGDTGGVTVSSK